MDDIPVWVAEPPHHGQLAFPVWQAPQVNRIVAVCAARVLFAPAAPAGRLTCSCTLSDAPAASDCPCDTSTAVLDGPLIGPS